jgi:ferredoxin
MKMLDAGVGESLMDLAIRAKLPLGRACGAEGVCRSCEVEVLAGMDHLSGIEQLETRWQLPLTGRLACQARVKPDSGGAGATLELWCPSWGTRPQRDPGD